MRSSILLIDDDLEDQFIFKDAMNFINSTESIHTEQNGQNAFKYLLNLSYDSLPCIIMADLNMPKMNGAQFLNLVKSTEYLKSIPVVIYSTSENKLEQESCLTLGAHSYIAKPLNYKQSIEVAKTIVEICRKVNGAMGNSE
jgi:CheY-like chemotaxis protein